MKGVQLSAATCTWLFFGLLAYVFFFGGQTRFIIEEGITALGNMTQNFIGLSTWTDSLRTSSFPQTWGTASGRFTKARPIPCTE